MNGACLHIPDSQHSTHDKTEVGRYDEDGRKKGLFIIETLPILYNILVSRTFIKGMLFVLSNCPLHEVTVSPSDQHELITERIIRTLDITMCSTLVEVR